MDSDTIVVLICLSEDRRISLPLKEDKVWIGNTNVHEFIQPDGSVKKFGNIGWYTNMDIAKRHEKIILWKHYTSDEYPTYDNYNAINIDKVADIPMDYDGVMGVPITFLDKYNPDEFEILDARDFGITEKQKTKSTYLIKDADGTINGVAMYARIVIRNRNPSPMQEGRSQTRKKHRNGACLLCV